MLRIEPPISRDIPPRRRAFTLVELLVVVSIIIIMLSVAVPAVKSMMRSSSQKQSINVIRAYLSTARSVAISHHCQAGVVFFEESTTYAPPLTVNGTIAAPHVGQTAMQILIEDPGQYPTPSVYFNGGAFGGTPSPVFTGFMYYSRERQFLPAGVQVAVLNDSSTKQIMTGDTSAGSSRVILFDANGQLLLRNGISKCLIPAASNTGDAGYVRAYGDWNIASMVSSTSSASAINTAAALGVSSPGVLLFSMKDYLTYVQGDSKTGTALDQDKATWIQQHSDMLIVNAYTGNIIQ